MDPLQSILAVGSGLSGCLETGPWLLFRDLPSLDEGWAGGPALLPPVGTSTLCDSPHPLGGSPQLEGGLPGGLTHAWKGRRAKGKAFFSCTVLITYKPESAEVVSFRRTEHGIQAGAQFFADVRSGSKGSWVVKDP